MMCKDRKVSDLNNKIFYERRSKISNIWENENLFHLINDLVYFADWNNYRAYVILRVKFWFFSIALDYETNRCTALFNVDLHLSVWIHMYKLLVVFTMRLIYIIKRTYVEIWGFMRKANIYFYIYNCRFTFTFTFTHLHLPGLRIKVD